MHIGQAKKLQDVTRESFMQLGEDLKLSSRVSNLLLDDFCEEFKEGIDSCEAESGVAEKIKLQSLSRFALL